ncbi:hypothetical protein S83_055072, partial [Arachis hypogaea]
ELPKDPMASQETLAVPNTEVNALVQQEFGLGDLGLINGHETPIPPYGSHQWLLQTIWNLCSLPEKKRVLQLLLPEGSLQQSHDNSRGEAIRHHAKKSVIQLDEEIEKINFLNKKREWRTRDPHFCQAGRTILLVYRNVILKNEYQSSKLCEALYTNCEDMMDRLQVLRLPSKAKFNAGLQNCTHSFENECVRPSKTNYEQRITKMLGKSKSQFIKDYNQRLFNWLVAFSLVMIVIGRFIIKFILIEMGAWLLFIFLETYTRITNLH